MKAHHLTFLFALLCLGCGRNEVNSMFGPPPNQIDQQQLTEASAKLCPSGQKLVESTDNKETVEGLANPDLISFVHARGRCALVESLHEGSLIDWLSFEFRGGCLQNGVLWTSDKTRSGSEMRWNLIKYDQSQDYDVRMRMNPGMRVKHIEKSTGMAIFYCRPASLADPE